MTAPSEPPTLPADVQPVVVTGATGFIGRRLVEALLRADVQVRALVLPDDSLPPGWDGRVEVHRGDVTDRASVIPALEGARTVMHLAAVVGDHGGRALHRRVTVEGTRNVLEEAARVRARAVLASSVTVYADAIDRDVCDEDHPFGRPLGPYSESKQAQEHIARRLEAEAGLAVTIVRPTNVIGVGSGPWFREAGETLRSGLPTVVGDGEQDAGLVYVDDVADALARVVARPDSAGRAYNVNGDYGVSWRRYLTDLAALLGAPRPRSLPRPLALLLGAGAQRAWELLGRTDRPPASRDAVNLVAAHHRVPTRRARMELGWAPRTSYEEAMAAIALAVR